MGLQLNTAVGYGLVDQTFGEEGELIEVDRYSGNGGTNRVFLGYGYKFPFDLSLGLEAAYIFGSIDNNVVNRREGVQLATQHRTDSNVRGSKIKVGAHYAPNITDRIKLKLGIAGELDYELTEEGDETVFSTVNIDDGVLRPIDTL